MRLYKFSPSVAIILCIAAVFAGELLFGAPFDKAFMPAVICVALGTLLSGIAVILARRQISGVSIVIATIIVAACELIAVNMTWSQSAQKATPNPFDRFDNLKNPVDLNDPAKKPDP